MTFGSVVQDIFNGKGSNPSNLNSVSKIGKRSLAGRSCSVKNVTIENDFL